MNINNAQTNRQREALRPYPGEVFAVIICH